MLQLNQVCLRRGDRVLFSDASMQVHPGQKLGVTGANGSGKSSLFEAMLGSLETDEGNIQLEEQALIAHVSQQSPSSDQSALDFVLDGDAELRSLQAILREDSAAATELQNNAWAQLEVIDGYTAESRAARLLHGLGFAQELINNPVNSFSGGWRMRLNLAQALMCRSDLLLLDEPTNHLDLPAILWLETWLKRYQGILLVVSHDRDFLDAVCTRIANIEQLKLTLYGGNYSQFEKVRAEQLAQQQAMYGKQQKEISHLQSYVDRFRYKASKAKQAQSRLKMIGRMVEIAPAHVDSPFHFTIPIPDKQPQHLLQLTDVTAGYDNDVVVLSDVKLHIGAGDRLGLLGVNGAGKSTLVKALANGSTLLTGERIIHRDTRIGYFTQHQLELLDVEQSPLDHMRHYHPDDREQDLRNYLGSFGFNNDRIFDPVGPFSGGEKARLVLAMIIRQKPNLLLLDEPTNHLDLEMRQALSMALMSFEGALVVISHDRHLLRTVCDELVIVHDGFVDEFDQSLDDYPAWLADREANSEPNEDQQNAVVEAPSKTKKERKREEAEARAILKPLTNRVKKIDKEMAQLKTELAEIEASLSDELLYQDPERKSELTDLIKSQSEKKSRLDELEWSWLEASEELEKAKQ